MSKFALGVRSRNNLNGVNPQLVAVVERAIQITNQDFLVLEGVRSKEKCWENYGKGRTAAECIAKSVPTKYAKPAEPKVTWLNNPLASKHCLQADGTGHAVDLVPWPIDWGTLSKFDEIARAMMQAAKELNVSIRWGKDWNANGIIGERGEVDSPHFEIIAQKPRGV